VDNLVRHAERLVIMTAGWPGQGGLGHINCRPKADWIGMFTGRGWTRRERVEAEILTAWEPLDAAVYMTRNLMVFEMNTTDDGECR